MLLRSDAQIVLHRIVMLCMEAFDHYSISATRCHNTGLDKMFNSLAISHSQMATELTEHIRCMGDFPGSSDREREVIGKLIRQLRELSSCNFCDTMLEDHLRMEARLLDAVHEALAKCSESATERSMHKVNILVLATQERLAIVRSMTRVVELRSE